MKITFTDEQGNEFLIEIGCGIKVYKNRKKIKNLRKSWDKEEPTEKEHEDIQANTNLGSY
jgi:hypothetical protein